MSVATALLVYLIVNADGGSGYDGITSFIGWGLFVTIPAVFTVAAAVVVGLPVRLIPSVRQWWINNCEIAVAGILAGWAAIAVSALHGSASSGTDEYGQHFTALEPDWGLLLLGWVLVAFFTTHFWVPARWRRGAGARVQGIPDRGRAGGRQAS